MLRTTGSWPTPSPPSCQFWGWCPSSSRFGAQAVTDALEGAHRYSVEPKTTLLLRNASLPHGETEKHFLRMMMESHASHSPFSSDPHARMCGDSAVASCALADVFQFGFWTLASGRLSLSRWTPPVHVELDRKQFFAIELDFKIVFRDRALMLDPRRVRPDRLPLRFSPSL